MVQTPSPRVCMTIYFLGTNFLSPFTAAVEGKGLCFMSTLFMWRAEGSQDKEFLIISLNIGKREEKKTAEATHRCRVFRRRFTFFLSTHKIRKKTKARQPRERIFLLRLLTVYIICEKMKWPLPRIWTFDGYCIRLRFNIHFLSLTVYQANVKKSK